MTQNASERSSLLKFFSRKQRSPNVRQALADLVKESASLSKTSEDPPELDRQERALILNVLHLRDITADDAMVPRADIVAMPDNLSYEEALALMRTENHSRLPVYHEELDDVVGMIHLKDLISYDGPVSEFDLRKLLRQPLFVAPTIPVLDLMLQMRQRRTHMALVIDEYGSIDGLVTIEDLIETIVGDISDEHDEPVTTPWRVRADGAIDLDPRLPIEVLEEKLGPVLTESERETEIETVGGLVFRLAEHVPARDEVITHPSGLIFRVMDADTRHILALRMHIPDDWTERHKNGTESGNDNHHAT